jgi:O-antigen ligase
MVSLAVLTLPFTAALTLNLRFPLKIYEAALLFAGVTCVAQQRIQTVRSAARAARWVAALVAWAIAVLLLHIWLPPQGLAATGLPSRFGPLGDEVAKLLYLLLSLVGFLLVAQRAYEDEREVIRFWLIGAVLASVYTWYLFTSSLLGVSPLLLPGDQNPQLFTFGNLTLIRSGTFEEGNYLGLYLLLSIMLALRAEQKLLALFLACTVLVTFSTVNVAALALVSAALIWRGPLSGRARFFSVLAGLCVIFAFGALLVGTGYIQNVIASKVAGENAVSRLDRIGSALAGIRMFLDHPVTGVGISQFGYYYRSYELFYLSDFSVFTYKRIANNVYVELLSELGAVGFFLYAGFIFRIWQKLRATEFLEFRVGFLAMLFVWNAFPTYTTMFLWAFWGLILGASARLEAGADGSGPAEGRLADLH